MNIGFIGAGAMAEAIIRGVINSKILTPGKISCGDISSDRVQYMRDTYGVLSYVGNEEVIRGSDLLILAVKPHIIKQAAGEIKGFAASEKIVVSIAAGVTLQAIENWLGGDLPVIRIMPNTPCLIGEGVSALSPGEHADKNHIKMVRKIFESVGTVIEIPEQLMDPVTGVSGSGPAYIYLVIEAMTDAGVALGLPRNEAQKLVTKTIVGAAKMVDETGMHPAILKANVTSPGGTTAAALRELEAHGMRTAFDKAISASCEKASKFGK